MSNRQRNIIARVVNNADFCIFRVPLKPIVLKMMIYKQVIFLPISILYVAKSNSTFHFAAAAMLSKVLEFWETAAASLQGKSN